MRAPSPEARAPPSVWGCGDPSAPGHPQCTSRHRLVPVASFLHRGLYLISLEVPPSRAGRYVLRLWPIVEYTLSIYLFILSVSRTQRRAIPYVGTTDNENARSQHRIIPGYHPWSAVEEGVIR